MKTKHTAILMSCIVILASGIIRAQIIVPPAATDTIELPAPATEPVPFTGGAMIGNVQQEKIDEDQSVFKLTGAVGFILPKDNTGGILTLTFAKPPENPVETKFRQFPLSIEPTEATLDGSPVEIQIAPGQVYQFMSIKNSAEIELSSIEFKQDTTLSDPEECECQQIKLKPETRFTLEDLTSLLD